LPVYPISYTCLTTAAVEVGKKKEKKDSENSLIATSFCLYHADSKLFAE